MGGIEDAVAFYELVGWGNVREGGVVMTYFPKL
jgi:hypothetical protein